MKIKEELHFIGLLIVWLLAGCAGYAAWIMYMANVQEAVTLANNFPQHSQNSGDIHAAFKVLRLALASVAVGLAILGGVLTPNFTQRSYSIYRAWRRGWQQAEHGLLRSWYSLQSGQQRWALATLAALTIGRVIVSRLLVTVDDSASYEYFVRKSLLTVTAYYPSPNNHILSNTVSWLLYQLYPGYWWSMRMPILLVSTATTAGWFLGLLHRTNFRVAALATTLFSFLESNFFYAAEGRGYALLLALSSLGFFCVVTLTDPVAETTAPTSARAWLGVAGIAGLYTVPTFAYFLVAAYSWLGFCWLRKGYYPRLVSLCLLGGATLLGVAFLYAPLLLVSGARSLFQNVYVKPIEATAFFQHISSYIWEVEGELLGEAHNGVLASVHAGSLAAVAVLVGFSALAGAAHRGRLPVHQATYILRVGLPAFWFALSPYALLLLQRVQAPSRTLEFKASFMFILIGIEADWLLRRFGSKIRHLRVMLLLCIILWAGTQLVQLYRSNELRLSYLRTPHLVAKWLLKQPPGPVLAPGSPWYLSSIRFYLHFEKPTSSLAIDGAPRSGVHYRYLINPPADSLSPPSAHLPHLHIDQDLNCEAINITTSW